MKKILFLLFLSAFTFSCSKDFVDLNTDKKKPSSVPPGALFTGATKSLVDVMTSSNVNTNIFRMMAQYWTETTYIDEANYDLTTRNIPQNFWNTMYLSVLKNLDETKKVIPNEFQLPAVYANEEACVEILNVYAYMVMVNVFGNIPYSEALDYRNVYPKYDNASDIYADLATRLDAALAKIDVSQNGFGSSDLLYGGDMAGWKTFGNSLKMKIGITLADADPAKAKSMIEAAAPNAISSNAENVAFHYLDAPPNTNPIWVDLVQSGRKDFVAANTLVDYMNSVSDPRVPLYFTVDANGAYVGGIYAANNNYATYSKPADAILAPNFESLLMDYSEVEFILAEAAERGMNVGGTAADHYAAGIRASIEYWGGTTAAADTYLASPSVAYATATGDWKQKIGTQKWVALYNRGMDGWTEWRRLDYPVLNVPAGLTYADIPRRFTYPVQEQNLNTKNYDAASTAIGGDNVQSKIFWDKN